MLLNVILTITTTNTIFIITAPAPPSPPPTQSILDRLTFFTLFYSLAINIVVVVAVVTLPSHSLSFTIKS